MSKAQVSDTRTLGVGSAGNSAGDNLALPVSTAVVGHVEPIQGRIAKRDVEGYFGFPLIRAGEAVTEAVLEKAQSQGRLYEVIASTQDV
jgi:hypothetical protein